MRPLTLNLSMIDLRYGKLAEMKRKADAMLKNKGMQMLRQILARMLRGALYMRYECWRQNWLLTGRQAAEKLWKKAMEDTFHIPMYAGVIWEYQNPTDGFWTPYSKELAFQFEQQLLNRNLGLEVCATNGLNDLLLYTN